MKVQNYQRIRSRKSKARRRYEKRLSSISTLCKWMLREDKYHVLELTKIAKNNGDNYKYIKVRNTGGILFQ